MASTMSGATRGTQAPTGFSCAPLHWWRAPIRQRVQASIHTGSHWVAEPDLAGEQPGYRVQLRSPADDIPVSVMVPRYACRQ